MRTRNRIGAAAVVIVAALGSVSVLPVSAAGASGATSTTSLASVASLVYSDEIAREAAAALTTLRRYGDSGDVPSWTSYEQRRDGVAALVAQRLEIAPDRLVAAWDAADLTHQTAVVAALTQLGVPYRSRASKPGVAFDCSGLTGFAWSSAGIEIARSSRDQIRGAGARDVASATAGDLVYYPGHVMMWLGVDSAIVHSPNSGDVVEVKMLSDRRTRTVRYGDPLG